MKTKILLIATLGLLLVGCEEVQTDMREKESIGDSVKYFVDPKTGVNYLIYSGGYDGGITVRYNADGSIMVKGDKK